MRRPGGDLSLLHGETCRPIAKGGKGKEEQHLPGGGKKEEIGDHERRASEARI